MSAKIAKTVVDNLDNCVHDEDLGMPYFSGLKNLYKTYPLVEDSFVPINSVETEKKIAFVDGGNQEIIGAPNFSIQLNRVYFNVFEGGQRSLRKNLSNKLEFFSTTVSTFKNNEIFYETSIVPLKEEFSDVLPQESTLSFSSFDPTLTSGRMRAEISRVASIARRFAE